MHEIVEWEKIKDKFHDGLLLGNGASIAVHTDFNYNSLYEKTTSLGYITSDVLQIFTQFKTQDFELILQHLWHAKLVNKVLNIDSEKVDKAYTQVQNALRLTISDIHPKYDNITGDLIFIYQFMQHFKTIFSLNYDLIVYWATQLGNEKIGNWFKDGFTQEGNLDDNISRLYEPFKAEGATLFFYPHGNIVLARIADGAEEKIHCQQMTTLLETILKSWKEESIVPIFVCEGKTELKKLAVNSASYLSQVYYEIIPSLTKSLVIYGWSMSEQDQHILEQLNKKEKEPLRVAVSVHDNNQEYAESVFQKLKKQGIVDVIFFNAASPGCWNNVSA